MEITKDEQATHHKMLQQVAVTQEFMNSYQAARKTGASRMAAFDSVVAGDKEAIVPEALLSIFDSVGLDNHSKVLGGLEVGIKGFQDRNGGDMPSAQTVLAALAAGQKTLHTSNSETNNTFDSVQLSSSGSESTSVVATLPIVTIATRIANALPLVNYLPNAMGSNEVPIIYGRQTAANTYGATTKGDYLDGANASNQYIDPQFEFEATSADQLTYSTTAHVHYQADGKTADTASALLPIVGGRVVVLVNGIEVANDSHQSHGKFVGNSTIIALDDHGYKIAGTAVKMTTGVANLTTSEVTVTFATALPADAKVSFAVVADYEAKDSNNKPRLLAPSVDIELIKRSVRAVGIRAIYRATIDAITQMQNELGLDQRGAVVAVVANKYQLEQNIRLLKSAKRRAVGFGRVFTADISRGSTGGLTAAFNSTADQSAELIVTIDAAKLAINDATNNAPSGFDVFVSGKLAILMMNLRNDTGFNRTGATIGAPDQITRIGSFPDGTNVYHVPPSSKLLTESGNAAQLLVIARNSEAAKSIFVGFVAVPVVTSAALGTDFEQGVAIYTRQAATLNPIERFADQAAVVEVINLPVSIAS